MNTRTSIYVTITFCLFFALLVPVFVLAQGNATSARTSTPSEQEPAETTRDNVASRTEAVREAAQEQRATQQEVREERRAGLRQAALDRIQNLLGNMVRRMHAAVGRLEDVARRLASRADKIAERLSIDVGTTHTLIDDAEKELASARELLGNLIDETNGTLGEPNPRTQFVRVRAQLSEAANHIRTAHRMLREAVAELKNVVAGVGSTDGVRDAVQNNTATSSEEIVE